MSLYNMMFGVEPTAGISLMMLGISQAQVPRLRDAFLSWADDTKIDPVIVILTRTGGGNRSHYDSADSYRAETGEDGNGPWNSDLKALKGYRLDRDVDVDSTYAEFFFDVPEEFRERVTEHLKEHGQPLSVNDKFEAVMKSLKAAAPV